jgi:hypothetical protein
LYHKRVVGQKCRTICNRIRLSCCKILIYNTYTVILDQRSILKPHNFYPHNVTLGKTNIIFQTPFATYKRKLSFSSFFTHLLYLSLVSHYLPQLYGTITWALLCLVCESWNRLRMTILLTCTSMFCNVLLTCMYMILWQPMSC